MGDNAAGDMDRIEVPMAVETEETPTTGMITRNAERAAVKDNGTFIIIEGVGKIVHIEVDADNGTAMIQITGTVTNGIEIPMVKGIPIEVEDGIIIIEVKDTAIVEEGDDGIPIGNITIQGINRTPSFLTQVIIIHRRWDINTDTQSHMANIHIPSNNNINHKCQLHLNRLQIFVSCVIVKAIMIINVNLQVILWPEHKKPLIKADHTANKTLILGNGHKVKMITMTLVDNLFSSGGSRCC